MRALRRDDGFALVLALACIVVFGISTAAAISYTTSNQQASVQSASELQARQYAESGLNDAVSTLWHTNANGSDPTASGLLGTSASPLTFCITTTSCSSGNVGSANVAGCYGGTNGATCTGISPSSPASTWVIVSTGYAKKPDGTTISRTATSEVVVSPLNSGAVAAVWNHVFLTAPLVPNVCQTVFSGNSVALTVPLYVIGNLCSGGNTFTLTESTQPVDLMVGGKLILSGQNSAVGASAASPITSGIVVGGCNTTLVTDPANPCDNGGYRYWVHTKDQWIAQDAPTHTDAQITADYNNFDPGPKHPCQAGNNPNAPLAASVFDNNTVYDNSAGTFNLTPSSGYTNGSYSCVSAGGAGVGQLQWDNTAKTLTINGNIFIDGNLTIDQSFTYTGVGIIEVAGTVTFTGNNVAVCAVSGCTASNWQGSSGHNQMLTLAALAANSNSVNITGNAASFQGSLWTQPSSKFMITGNAPSIQGPLSIGSINWTGNAPTLVPLPVIRNMPVGAPVPPNTGVTIGAPTYIK